MQRTHRHVQRLLNTPASGKPPYHWHQVLGMLTAVTQTRSAAGEAALRRIAVFSGKLRLDPSHGLPHAMPPEDLIRLVAIQQLARWDRRKHRDVICRAAEVTETDAVRRLAKALVL
ncbi:MAG: hypothetical protein ABI836_06040 [Gemmatimonadota bacterium]